MISNIDDYKLQTSISVPFSFNKYSLTNDVKQDLDKLAGDAKSGKRFFITVEGYTGMVGSREYNDALSRRRANSVVEVKVFSADQVTAGLSATAGRTAVEKAGR